MIRFWRPVTTLWWREVVRFVRQKSRLLGAFAQPLVFWMLLGGGMNASFRPSAGAGGTSYVEYFYPGVMVMVLLFTAIFATISTVEDRRQGFLQGVLVARRSCSVRRSAERRSLSFRGACFSCSRRWRVFAWDSQP